MTACFGSDDVYSAEAQLSRGQLQDACSSAIKALRHVQDCELLGRAYSVLIQGDFQENRLTDIETTLKQFGHQYCQLPATVILLWGVVAIELDSIDRARVVLGTYLAECNQTTGISREDAMALSRLYAVQLLGNCCRDFAAAATWLESGGAGLSHEQQELLLLELEEAEEVLQEERLAEWAATHSVEAASPAPGQSAAEAVEDADTITDITTQHSLMTPASVDLSPVDASSRLGSAGSALTEQGDLGPPADGDVQPTQQQADNVTLPAFEAPGGQENQFVTVMGPVELEFDDSGAAACSEQQQHQKATGKPAPESQDDNAFCTMTGLLEELGEATDVDGSAAVVASPADGAVARAGLADSTSSGGVIHSRDQSHARTVKSAVVASAAASPAAVDSNKLGVRQEGSDVHVETAPETTRDQQQQQDSLFRWMSNTVSNAWRSQTMQSTLNALHLQDLEPWELAGGLGVAVLLGYSVYRERKTLKRGAADLASGVVQTAHMALGMSVNPMSAVPNTGHTLR